MTNIAGKVMGPNVTKLIILKMSRDAIPDGGGLADGIEFFTNQDKRRHIIAEAQTWVTRALQEVRMASEPNPWRDADDEAIAGELLHRLDERQGK